MDVRPNARGGANPLRFLIDECLSPTLCDVAHEAGHLAFHVAHRGLSGARDYRLRELIVREELMRSEESQRYLRADL